MKEIEVIIIGAGVAGLQAANILVNHDIVPIVLESNQHYAGGRLSGDEPIIFEYQGKEWEFQAEHAVHGIWHQYKNFIAFLEENNISADLRPAVEETWIYRDKGRIRMVNSGSAIRGGWFPAPFHYLNLFVRPRFWQMLSFWDVISLPFVLYTLIFALGIDPLEEDQPLEGWVLSDLLKNWGPRIRAFMISLTWNGLAADPEEIPLSGFISFLRFFTVLGKNRWKFSYLADSAGKSVIEPIIENLTSKETIFRFGEHVISLDKAGDKWVVKTDKYKYLADYVILATDEKNAVKLLPPGRIRKNEGLETLVIRLWYTAKPNRGAEAGIFSGDYMLDNFFWLNEIYHSFSRWGDEINGCVFEGHVYGPPDIISQPNAAILARAIQEVEATFPNLKGNRVHQHLQRNEATHTLFSVGNKEDHPSTNSIGEKLILCGDWVRFKHPSLFLERACVSGILAANIILKELQYPECEIIPLDPPEKLANIIQKTIRVGRRLKNHGKKS